MEKQSSAASELSPKFAVMGFLYLRPMHGYELHKQLETSLRDVWHISQSQSYAILKNLEKEGWLTVTRQPQEKRPDREVLALTEVGKNRFESWLTAPTPASARAIRVEFITRLFFASNLSETLRLRLIREQEDAIRLDLEKLSRRLSALPVDQIYNRMGVDLRVRQLRSVLKWVEDCNEYFEEGSRS